MRCRSRWRLALRLSAPVSGAGAGPSGGRRCFFRVWATLLEAGMRGPEGDGPRMPNGALAPLVEVPSIPWVR